MAKFLIPLLFPFLALLTVIFLLTPSGFTTEKVAGISVSGSVWALGYSLLRWGENKGFKILLGMLFGGILFRIAVVLLSIFFVQKFTELELFKYVISLLILYLAFEFALISDYLIRK